MAIWRTTLEQTYAAVGGPGFSTLHFRHDGIESDLAADLLAAQTAFAQALGKMQGQIQSTTRWRFSGVWQDVGGEAEVTTPNAVVQGTASGGGAAPSATALVLGWRTESRSRSGRGRTFLSGWPAGSSTDGTPADSILTAARACIADVINFNEDFANGAWCVYSPTDALARDITGGAVRDIWAVLRSRRD